MYARDKKQDNTSSVKNSKSKETAIQFKDLRSEGEHQNAISSSLEQSPRLTAQKKKMDSLQKPLQKKENKTGLPDQLKSGIESLSGMDMSDTRVHYNSSKPAQLHAHAYAQGNQIHVAPGQEKHVAHEAWHVVQQKQGRVRPTMQMKGKVNINDDAGLEREADVMGAKAMQLSNQSQQQSLQLKSINSRIVQRVDATSENIYSASLKPPTFEYWANSMWQEVENTDIRNQVLTLLKNNTANPKPGGSLSTEIKSQALTLLYNNAYTQHTWVNATRLLEQKALSHKIVAPKDNKKMNSQPTTIAVGFHGTWRDSNTLINVHKGTNPTIERHDKSPSQTAEIKQYLNDIGIYEWHPFWFEGNIAERPFLFRKKKGDNELDTTISVAKSAIDSLDFPLLNIDDETKFDKDGFATLDTYVYVVGVKEGFNTKSLQSDDAFGEGEIATKFIKTNQHFGYIHYHRVFAGTSRNDGYEYKRAAKPVVLPAARKLRITSQVENVMKTMPNKGYRYASKEKFNVDQIYHTLKVLGIEKATKPGIKAKWSDEQWKKYSVLNNQDAVKYAPSAPAKEKRIAAFLEGVRSVLPKPN